METFEIPFYKNSLKVTYSSTGVVEITWQKKKANLLKPKNKKEQEISKTLNSYLNGKSDADLKIDWANLEGTEFQKSVWRKMAKIPYGKTKSYGEIAKSLKKPGAARAVGTACGKNPILLAIPCHRVVGSNGLGGFSGGGIPVKKKLHGIESISL